MPQWEEGATYDAMWKKKEVAEVCCANGPFTVGSQK